MSTHSGPRAKEERALSEIIGIVMGYVVGVCVVDCFLGRRSERVMEGA